MTSQRPAALHHLEHPGRSDVGVYMCRRLLRDGINGKTPPDSTRSITSGRGETLPMYTSDNVVRIPKRDDGTDREALAQTARSVLAVLQETDRVPRAERRTHVLRRLDEFDGGI